MAQVDSSTIVRFILMQQDNADAITSRAKYFRSQRFYDTIFLLGRSMIGDWPPKFMHLTVSDWGTLTAGPAEV